MGYQKGLHAHACNPLSGMLLLGRPAAGLRVD